HDEFLRDPLRLVGYAAVVAQDDLDLATRDRVATLLGEDLDRGGHLLAVLGERPGERRREADLHGLLTACGRRQDGQGAGGRQQAEEIWTRDHGSPHRLCRPFRPAVEVDDCEHTSSCYRWKIDFASLPIGVRL